MSDSAANNPPADSGLTFVELIVTFFIVSILVMTGFVAHSKHVAKSEISVVQSDVKNTALMLNTQWYETGQVPKQLRPADITNSEDVTLRLRPFKDGFCVEGWHVNQPTRKFSFSTEFRRLQERSC